MICKKPMNDMNSDKLNQSNASNEDCWIGRTFFKRECIKYITDEKNPSRCVCGRINANHMLPAETIVRVAYPVEHWNIYQYTESSPTNAYGTIEFQGGPHPNKAHYVRLSFDTKPERIMQLLQNHWRLGFPNLLISVHGGIANFDLQPKLKRVCSDGLLKASTTTGAWVITGGTNTGVMKHVGDALGDTLIQTRNNIVTIGIAPWGVIHKKETLIGNNVVIPYHSVSTNSGDSIVLNSNHSYFLLVDDGTAGKFGCELMLRKRLEKYISQQRIRNSAKDYGTPVVCLLMEGGSNSIRSVLDYVTDHPPVPVVVVDGTGRAADLISFTHKHANNDLAMPDSVKEQLLITIGKTFQCNSIYAEQILTELILCTKKKSLITIYRIGENTQEIDHSILIALLKGQNTSYTDQLNFALSWDRVDIARNYIFNQHRTWPDNTLDNAMMEALVNNRVGFVQLLMENGVSMHKWLTVARLEELYNIVLTQSQYTRPSKLSMLNKFVDRGSTLKHVLTEHRRNLPPNYQFTLYDIGQAINQLMSGAYQSPYCSRKFRHKKDDSISLQCERFKYPFSELMVWAVLLRRHTMAKFMWQNGEEALAKALVACRLNKSLAKEAEEDELEVDIANELRNYQNEFSNLSLALLDQCYKSDDDMTQMLLTYELSDWSKQTCLSLAVLAAHRTFLSHTCCQVLLSEMWMGGLRTRKYASLKVLFGLFFPPCILFFNFRSREELRLMPQTLEDCIHAGDLSCDSDSSDSETSSVASHHSTHSVHKVQESFNMNAQHRPACSFFKSLTPSLHVIPAPQQSPLTITKKIFEFYTAPITKFWLHAIGYAIFLSLFIYTVLISTPINPSPLEWYIFAYMIGFLLEKIREIVISEPTKVQHKFKIYFSDFWNVFDSFTLIMFFIGFFLRLQPAYLLDSRVFFCISVSLCIIRIVDFFVISQHLGPLVHIIGKMIQKLLYFVAFLLVIIASFGTFRQGLWYPNAPWFYWDLVREIFLKPYFMLYGEVYADEVWPDCTDNVTDIFDLGQYQCISGRWLVPIGQSLFLIIGIVLLLSLLIAVFNAVFLRTYILSNEVWKFQRYSLVLEFEARPILPSPLIIFSLLFLAIKNFRRKCMNRRKFFDNGLKLFLHDEDIERLHDFEEECVEIYHREKGVLKAASTDDVVKQMAEKIELVQSRLEDMHLRESKFSQTLASLETHICGIEHLLERLVSNSASTVVNQDKPTENRAQASFIAKESFRIRTVSLGAADYTTSSNMHEDKLFSLKKHMVPNLIMPRTYLGGPSTPMVHTNRPEYTSITDTIDISCLAISRTPPDTPNIDRSSYNNGLKKNKKKRTLRNHRRVKSKITELNQDDEKVFDKQLLKVEDSMAKQLVEPLSRRMRQISLTENNTYSNLARHALENIENLEDYEESVSTVMETTSDGPNIHVQDFTLTVADNDDDITETEGELELSDKPVLMKKRLKAVKSEPEFRDLNISESILHNQEDMNDSGILSFSVGPRQPPNVF